MNYAKHYSMESDQMTTRGKPVDVKQNMLYLTVH